jgi:hypothetical protein
MCFSQLQPHAQRCEMPWHTHRLGLHLQRCYLRRKYLSFANLHPNVGARLQSEVILRPPALLNLVIPYQGGETIVDHVVNNSNHATNGLGLDSVENNAGRAHTIAETGYCGYTISGGDSVWAPLDIPLVIH